MAGRGGLHRWRRAGAACKGLAGECADYGGAGAERRLGDVGFPMSGYRARNPWFARFFAVMIGVLIVMCLLILTEARPRRKSLASGPGLALAIYVGLVNWRNEYELVAGREGLRITVGPLPGPEALRVVPRAEIARVYVRTFVVNSKYGGRFRTAGVELQDGDTIDIAVSCPPHPGMAAEAERIAAAIGWTGGVVTLEGAGKKRWRWAGAVGFVRLALGIGLCGAWAYFVL